MTINGPTSRPPLGCDKEHLLLKAIECVGTVSLTIGVTCLYGGVPLAMKTEVKVELKRVTEKDVIALVEKPTDGVSRMVIATKRSEELHSVLDSHHRPNQNTV